MVGARPAPPTAMAGIGLGGHASAVVIECDLSAWERAVLGVDRIHGCGCSHTRRIAGYSHRRFRSVASIERDAYRGSRVSARHEAAQKISPAPDYRR